MQSVHCKISKNAQKINLAWIIWLFHRIRASLWQESEVLIKIKNTDRESTPDMFKNRFVNDRSLKRRGLHAQISPKYQPNILQKMDMIPQEKVIN